MFDPDGPADSSRLYGLDHTFDEATVVIVPVPFDATASSRRGTMAAPEAIRYASAQVDLHDLEFGDVWRAGIALEPLDERVQRWNVEAREAVDRVRIDGSNADRQRANAIGDDVERYVHDQTARILDAGKIPAILGGDHSVPLGAVRAAVARHPGLGVLHVDAHADMRDHYEGFTHSHASIFYNLVTGDPRPATVVQVGIRDVGPQEWVRVRETAGLRAWSDPEIGRALVNGQTWGALVEEILAPLPAEVWLSVDIDGLQPNLCPNTGTPVPGGLDWTQVTHLVRRVAESGRRVVGFDLVEVGPDEWDANVGARLLYKLCGAAVKSRS
ncbi:MAG: arginase family protein [Myxococcales bacterium]|nr:arginase family protein [Myxococcales bacterium]MCB9736564.1 arginase family protein [Deltaproteobacteria bacterium]